MIEPNRTLSPYSYVAGNPINFVDPLGLDVIYLLDRNALPGLGSPGHAAVLVGSDATGWTYGSFSSGDTPFFRGDNLELNKFKTLDEAKKALKKYDDYARWKTTQKEDYEAVKEIGSWTEKSYWLTGQNCDDLASDAARAAGEKVKDKWKPVKSFEELKKSADESGKWPQ